MIMFAPLLVAMATTVAGAANTPSAACSDTILMERQLKDKYQESVVMVGLIDPQVAMQLWFNPDTQTFSVVFRGTDGISCIRAVGKSGQFFQAGWRS